MNKSTRLLVTAAAMAGLYTGVLATKSFAADAAGKEDTAKKDAAKHDCKGKNSCKGHGGCSTMDKKEETKK